MFASHEIEEEKVIRNPDGFTIAVAGGPVQSEINRSSVLTHCPRSCQSRIITVGIGMRFHQTQHAVIKQVAAGKLHWRLGQWF